MTWRRDGCTDGPTWVGSAVAYAVKPSVMNRGTPSGAQTRTSGWTIPWATATARSPTSIVRRSVAIGSIATHTQCVEHDRQGITFPWHNGASSTFAPGVDDTARTPPCMLLSLRVYRPERLLVAPPCGRPARLP
jgi:hypothetical protein